MSLSERALRGALVVCLAFASVSLAGAGEPIVIGEINPLTGALALQGTAVHHGIVLALEEQNARGGIAGRSLLLLSRDDEGRPERAISAAEELAGRRQAVALIGGYVDSLVGPISEVADRARVPYLATASLDERLTGRGNRYFFRVSSLAGYVRPMTGFVESGLGARRVAVFYSPTPGATQLARHQREVFERAGIRVMVYEPLAAGLSDFSPLLGRVRDQGPDVLISNTFFADHLVLLRQMAQGGIRLRAFLGAFGMEFPDVIRSLGPAAEGLYGTTAWQPGIAAPGQEGQSQVYIEAFTRRFGAQPAPLAMHGYAAARTLLAALDVAARGGRPLTGPVLRDALAAVDVMTPMGRVRFDERGDPVEYERVILQIQDGRHVVVWPKDRAQAAAR